MYSVSVIMIDTSFRKHKAECDILECRFRVINHDTAVQVFQRQNKLPKTEIYGSLFIISSNAFFVILLYISLY